MNFPLYDIYIPKQNRLERKGNIKLFEAVDVETDKGYGRIVANSKRYVEVNNIQDVFNFLCSKDHENKLNFHYNLAFDFEVMFKHEPEIFNLLIDENNYDFFVKYNNYKISYIPRKMYQITKGHKTYKFYDIAQFFKKSLDNASEEYLNFDFNKLDVNGISYKQFKKDREHLFKKYPKDTIGKYCINDSYLTKELAKYFYEQLQKLNIFPLKPFSVGTIAEDYLKKFAWIPKFNSIPLEIQELYWLAYRGGWFDTYQKGYFDSAYQYDISSAYPYSLSQIPNCERGRWIKDSTNGEIGIIKAKVKVKSKNAMPIFPFEFSNVLVYPDMIEERTICLTLKEYHTLKNDYDFDIIESYSFEPNKRCNFPFKESVNKLYGNKQSLKSDIGQYMVRKEIVNSFYGKTAQRTKTNRGLRAGNLFNPYIACECTSHTRMMVYEASKGTNLISLCADGFISMKKAKMPLEEGLGAWELKHEDEPLIQVGNGIYQFEGGKCKHRGWKEERDLNKVLDTDNNPIPITVIRPSHWRECLRQHRIEDIGIFEEYKKTLDIIKDKKRIWFIAPNTPRDLLENNYQSVPIPVNMMG